MNDHDHDHDHDYDAPRSKALEAVTDEARAHFTPEAMGTRLRRTPEQEWTAMQARLDAVGQRQDRAYRRLAIVATAGAALSLAASIPFFMSSETQTKTLHASAQTLSPTVVSHLLRNLGSPEGSATQATSVRAGDHLSVRGSGRVVFEREAHEARRRIRWSLSATQMSEGSVQLSTQNGALVISLSSGIVEADVDPGSSLPVLFVQTGSSRVQVRGTHFRVERRGDDVTVDLTRGKVSVEASAMAGTDPSQVHMMIAPAHATFFATDARNFLANESARAEESFETFRAGASMTHAPSPSSASSIVSKALVLITRDQIAVSVRDCIIKNSDFHMGIAKISVESVFELKIDATGRITEAHFEPEIHPNAQRCAQAVIENHAIAERSATLRLPFDVAPDTDPPSR
jgi:hypothetical protein